MDTNSSLRLNARSGSRFRALLVALTCVLLLGSQFLSPNLAYASPALAPELIVEEFYGWYLKRLSADENPLSDERETLAVYVSKDLIKDIDREMKSAEGISEDYFLKSQDYLEEWQLARRTSKPIQSGSTRIVQLTLGSSPENVQTLSLTMIREDGTWKIRRVKSLKPMR